jgi:23S rRNA pseudouridine1911/1915/1917 synthase
LTLITRFSVSVQSAQVGRTLAEIVRGVLPPGSSWKQARELCKRGKVRRNGALAIDAAQRMAHGDSIEIDLHAPRRREHVLAATALVYVDAQLVVVNKPAGLLTVPFDSTDRNTLVDRLRFLLRRKFGNTGSELGVVQRLDKDTTGLLVFARTVATKRALQALLRRHDIERRYLALAHGAVQAQRIETHLVADRGDGLRGSHGHFRRASGAPPPGAQRAITHVRPLESFAGASLVECRLETGRQHQIRIHLSEQGHPLLGERVYVRDHEGPLIPAPRPMLHAAVLGFRHPHTGRALYFEQQPPPDFASALQALRAGAERW